MGLKWDVGCALLAIVGCLSVIGLDAFLMSKSEELTGDSQGQVALTIFCIVIFIFASFGLLLAVVWIKSLADIQQRQQEREQLLSVKFPSYSGTSQDV